ncbi:hypothetical protein B0H66DRAFT_569108 [Apodospora peruviana]|uniref:Uncharacterized protein n=1 Tax=Apodospora peruviana TaxID=516989 RepID=A0AAE0HU04_9PEZI|nr:hypothetical protein B0H66DRAFT_569108 [Apodospora peruviana]
MYRNDGSGGFNQDPIEFDVKQECDNRGVLWGDVNGDGMDDFIRVRADGNMYVSINVGQGLRSDFKDVGLYKATARIQGGANAAGTAMTSTGTSGTLPGAPAGAHRDGESATGTADLASPT